MIDPIKYQGYDEFFVYYTGKHAPKLRGSFIASRKQWRLPRNLYALKELYQEDNHPTLRNLIFEEEQFLDLIETLKKHTTLTHDTLRPYQAIDAEIIKANPKLAIFNEQRTGKTPTILSALEGITGGIVVCPSSLKLNWFNEAKVWSSTHFTVVNGTKKKRLGIYDSTNTETLIISYETLRTDIEDILKRIKKFNYLVVDEAHRLRNYKTKQSKALLKLRNYCDRIYPMTGTPAVNHPSDLYGILKLIDPRTYSSYWSFIERYFGFAETPFGRKVSDLNDRFKKEFQHILETTSIQRKRRDVMKWVPKVDFHTIELEPTAKQLSLFKEILRKSMVNGEPIPNAITKLTRLRQACVDPLYFGVETKTPKQAFIMDYLEDNPEPVIIFSTMTQTLNRLKAMIPDSVILTGEQSTVEKQWAVDQIQNGNARVLLANIRAGGVGFTLDKVDTIIFLDKSYTPDENQQAADRIIPTDPSKEYGAKQVITLVVNGSVEPKIEEMLNKKIDIIKYVNDYGIEGLFSIGKNE